MNSGPSKIPIGNCVVEDQFRFVRQSQFQQLYAIFIDDAVLIADIFESTEVA